jgi:hypothetical protein
MATLMEVGPRSFIDWPGGKFTAASREMPNSLTELSLWGEISLETLFLKRNQFLFL